MRKVIIVVDTARGWGRQFLKGVEHYTSAAGSWIVRIQPPLYVPAADRDDCSWPLLEDADGIIAGDISFLNQAKKLDIPKILHDARCDKIPGASTMYTDSLTTGTMAAEYFLSLGFKHFAYCGFEGLQWSQKRLEGYRAKLLSSGIEGVYSYNEWKSAAVSNGRPRPNISQWLSELPKPVCVFACNDDRGINVLEACRTASIKVPEEVAVLGVDNDELMCDISSPPLSSIELNFRKAGYEAACLLDEIMDGRGGQRDIIVKPSLLAERRSSDIFAIEDENLIKALYYIRHNYNKPIQVADVVQCTSAGRRDLEIKFKKYLKRSIKEEILRHRIESIKRRLINSNEPLNQIAGSLKYTDPEHFSRLFKSATGVSPGKFRREKAI